MPLVFYSCDEDNYTCSFYAWQSVLKCIANTHKLNNDDDGTQFWSLLNVRKAFIPKLIALLRSHANQNVNSQNVEIVYPALAPLISKLSDGVFVNTSSSIDEKLTFYKDVFVKLNDAVCRDNATSAVKSRVSISNRTLIVDAIFDCSSCVIDELSDQNEAKTFLETIISDYVRRFIHLMQ